MGTAPVKAKRSRNGIFSNTGDTTWEHTFREKIPENEAQTQNTPWVEAVESHDQLYQEGT